jgi:hypothetical protein
MRQYQCCIGREGTQHLRGGTVTKVVETAAQGLAIQRDTALPGGPARRLKQCSMATKTGLYSSRIEPLEDIADGRVRGCATPCETERFVQPVTMNIDEGDDATGRIAPGHDGKNRKQQHVGQAVKFSLRPARVGNISQQIQQRSKSSHGNPPTSVAALGVRHFPIRESAFLSVTSLWSDTVADQTQSWRELSALNSLG